MLERALSDPVFSLGLLLFGGGTCGLAPSLRLMLESDGREVSFELILVLGADVLREKVLIVDSFLGLLGCFLDGGLHPVSVVASRSYVEIGKLLLNVEPNFPILEVGVELDDLHALFLLGGEIMQVESNSVEGGEDGQSVIVA